MIFGGNDTSKLHVNFSGEMIFGGNDRQSISPARRVPLLDALKYIRRKTLEASTTGPEDSA